MIELIWSMESRWSNNAYHSVRADMIAVLKPENTKVLADNT
jgi:hypothetical protein